MSRVGSLAGLQGATTEDRARIRLDEMGFDLRITATGHYRLVRPDGGVSLDNHGSLTTALAEAKRWTHANPRKPDLVSTPESPK